MKLKDIFKRKKKANWNVFNWLSDLEFAECTNCGAEVEPDFTDFPRTTYPDRCPECGAVMADVEVIN